jgi:lipoate-protein ligase A
MSIFAALDVYGNVVPRTAAMNMAIDEALLKIVIAPSIRFYRWDHPALSFGYFGKFADVANHAGERDLVRRWTGGGIVFHGDDLTYSIIMPAIDAIYAESSVSIYAVIHNALRDALVANGQHAELAEGRDAALQRPRTAQRAVPTNACFAHPVPADVMLNGRKIAGAAQRRTRRGLLQQGSIQEVELDLDFEKRFTHNLSPNWTAKEIDESIIERAKEIAERKYLTQAWLYRR